MFNFRGSKENLGFAGISIGSCTFWTEDIDYPLVFHRIAVVKQSSHLASPMFESIGVLDIITPCVITLTRSKVLL